MPLQLGSVGACHTTRSAFRSSCGCSCQCACCVVMRPVQGIKNVPTRLRIVIQRKRNEDDEDSVSAAATRWVGVGKGCGHPGSSAQPAARASGQCLAEAGRGQL